MAEATHSDLRPAVLIVDDDESMRDLLSSILKKDYRLFTAAHLDEARAILQNTHIRVIFLDIRLKEENGLDLLREVKQHHDSIDVIVITAVNEVSTAVQAMKEGAWDYLTKDFNYDELHTLLKNTLAKQEQLREIQYLKEEVCQRQSHQLIFGKSPKMLEIRNIADRIASLPTTILILGETGCGKELLARYLHKHSHASNKAFVTVNIAAIPSELIESTLFGHEKGAFTNAHRLHFGKFELAHEGTLFLDEIGELDFDLQAKLLRVLQENEIERVGGSRVIPLQVRLIAATNCDLKEKVRKKEFREDLYYRLNVIPLTLPPLRERKEDIPELIEFFLKRYNQKLNRQVKSFSSESLQVLLNYNWPGNVRELEHLVERVVALSHKDQINLADIPWEYQLQPAQEECAVEGEDLLQKSIDNFEKSFLMRKLEENEWNQTYTAKRLGVHRKTLEYKIKRLDLTDTIEVKKKYFKSILP